jgi:hypothetical protein
MRDFHKLTMASYRVFREACGSESLQMRGPELHIPVPRTSVNAFPDPLPYGHPAPDSLLMCGTELLGPWHSQGAGMLHRLPLVHAARYY